MLPHPELPVLSEAAPGDFSTPEEVFEFGLDAIVAQLERML